MTTTQVDSVMHLITLKLRKLKNVIRIWERLKKYQMELDFPRIEEEMMCLRNILEPCGPFFIHLKHIPELENEKRFILDIQEASWWLKSQAI